MTKWHSKVIYLVAALVLALSFSLVTAVPVLAAPVVASVTETAFGTDTTDHNVDMPATVNAGDLLIALFTNDGSPTVTTPDGWDPLASNARGTAVRLSVYYKIAGGTEGGTTVNFVTSGVAQAAAQVYRITNWHGTTPPEISTAAIGTSTRPNPASLNPAGWDVADTLWLAVAGQDRGDQSGPTAYPASYTDGTSTLSSDGTVSCRTHSARRVLAAASENPGAFTIPVSEEWVAFTIAVRPAPHDLCISSTEGGSVTEPGEEVFTYDEGTVVDLVAEAEEGYRFIEWTGDVGTIEDVYAATTTITMNGDYSIIANFVAIHDLSISSTEGGSVTEPGEEVFTHDEGTVVDLVAEAEESYRFVEWTGNVGTIADVYATTTTITMNGDYSIIANFVAIHDLSISSTEGGSVTEPGEEVFTHDEGTVVDLVAEAEEGYRFVEWTGDVGTIADVYDATTTITMNDDYSITANFVARYDLSISSTAGGSVTIPGEGVFTYDDGTIVDLVAEPAEGYRFVEWTGDVGTIADVYDATTTITMNDDYSITANFVARYDLSISSTAGGSVTTPGEGVFTYDEGTIVDLVAEPAEGYRFVEWTGDVGTIADVYDATTTITMYGDYSITAEFVKQYDLTISSTEGGSVTTPGEGVFTYDEGTIVDLVAEPAEGYRFVEWTGDLDNIGDVYDATTTITMYGDYSITAEFVKQYDLTISSTEGGSVITPGEGMFTYDEGTVVDLVAEAEESYEFVEWTGDVGTIADIYDAETTITMNGNYSITANFEEVPPSPVYPTVTTQAATSITTNSTTLNMSYTVGDFSPVQVRFAYKKSTDSSWAYTDWVPKSGDGTHAESLTGLDSSTEYEFKAQLKYNGTVIGGTTHQFTTDTPSIPSPSGGCFIATAAYGTPAAEQIDVLREFRDVVLLESTVGSQFVALYYQLSPPVADFIAGNELLRTLVRELLVDPIVWVVEATGDIWQN